MKCPVCGGDCVEEAPAIIDRMSTTFAPCPGCVSRTLDKDSPLSGLEFRTCACGKRFLDEVIAQLYVIMVEEGDLKPEDPLKKVGFPLIHPGFAMQSAPYLPADSLILLSPEVGPGSAKRMVEEVAEIKGVVRCGSFTPGAVDVDLTVEPRTYELLAGCDVRADVFFTQKLPLVIYKQQSKIHIEFPRGYDPKIISVGVHVLRHTPKLFVDANCGAGTLGLLASMLGSPRVILNDAWYAASFWSGINLWVNRAALAVGTVRFLQEYSELEKTPVRKDPILVAESGDEPSISVYQGDFRRLPPLLPQETDILTVFDLFEKGNRELNARVDREWREQVGGDVFIP